MRVYRAPLVEPIAEVEAVDTHSIKEPACLEAGHSDWALTIPRVNKGKCSYLIQQ